MFRRVHRSWLPLVAAALMVLVILPTVASETDASGSRKWVAKCDSRVRLWPSTDSAVLKIIKAGAVVTSIGTVSGKRWSTHCGGAISGHHWLHITAINGKSTKSLFGRWAVYVAKGLFKLAPTPTPTRTPTPTPTPSTADVVSNCPVRLRAAPTVDADTTSIIDENTVVTAADAVTGGSWAADCGTSVSGTDWYRITEVGGQSVTGLYGVSAVYAASGLFRTVTTSSYAEGIDVSHWQGTINWSMVRASGKVFAFAKATEGIGYKDDSYDRNKTGAMSNGVKFGAYHFARPGSNNPVIEADWFVDNSAYTRGMMLPVLDLERTGNLTDTQLIAWVKAWLGRVYERLGVRAMIYASPSFWKNDMGNTRWFADNGYAMLWVAHWNTTSPSVPATNWGGRSWTFWQYSSEGLVPGISGRVDLDRYRFDSFGPVTYGGA
jgi:GH25 family lysozyme M1 (1,4-beta-N-acetylmuramidase)